MFCPGCGIKIDDVSARFCPECGTRLDDASCEDAQGKASFDAGTAKREPVQGLILTNLSLLALKFGMEKKILEDLLRDFVEKKRRCGVDYRVVDAGCYTYHKKALLWRGRTVRLDAGSEVWDYMDILMDAYTYGSRDGDGPLRYLFILGGDDIIPMPCIRHYIAGDKNDDTVDTDMLYAYPYGSDMLALLENRELFKYEPLFIVGRLPFSTDAVADDLVSYLDRDLRNSVGIPMCGAYGQCDPHWKNVSTRVAADLVNGGYLRNFDGRLSPSYYYHRLILSPEVNVSNVDQIFHTEASLYYYNLHGSDALEARGYFGVPEGESGAVSVLAPEHMASCHAPNIIVSEACYGGRFIGLDKSHSMLLSALSAQTLLFVGSSRVAWGGVDTQNSTPSTTGICHADVMAVAFINGMMEGYLAGDAFFAACHAVLESASSDNLYAALTVVEFNLYGDPTLGLQLREGNKSTASSSKLAPLVSRDATLGCKIECVETGDQGRTQPLLQRVRGEVDANLRKIREALGDYLYAHYGLKPRSADGVFAITYADGRKEMKFDYDYAPDDGQALMRMTAVTDGEGKIKYVLASR